MTSRKDIESEYPEEEFDDMGATISASRATSIVRSNKRNNKTLNNKSPKANPFMGVAQQKIMNSTTKSGQLESLNEEESLYDDDQFESISMSKSIVGIGGGLTGAKALVTKLGEQKKPQIQKKASVSGVSDDYSNEDFDSMSGISKSISQKPRIDGPNKFSNYPTPIKEQDESKYSN